MSRDLNRQKFEAWASSSPKSLVDVGITDSESLEECRSIISAFGTRYQVYGDCPADLFETSDASTVRKAAEIVPSTDRAGRLAVNAYLAFLQDSLIDVLLDEYATSFAQYRDEELYKWEAIGHFQQNWKPEEDDFAAMLERALSKSENLLTGYQYYPKGMLTVFAKMNPGKTREALVNLLDESQDLVERMKAFSQETSELLAERNAELGEGEKPLKNAYQDPRAMSVYLTFAHPETYYLYKYSLFVNTAKRLGFDTKGDKYDKVVRYQQLCDRILDRLLTSHHDLLAISDATVPPELRRYDPAHHILVQDIAYYVDGYSGRIKNPPSGVGPVAPKGDFPSMPPAVTLPGRNLILYGPPGTGKTYSVASMAWLIAQGRDPVDGLDELSPAERAEAKTWYDRQLADREDGRVAFTTFHQSYGYEEFIEGIRPVIRNPKNGDASSTMAYVYEDGIFKRFCKRAASLSATKSDEGTSAAPPYVFVIDEINRANISKVFGELITLIEPSKRIGQPDQQTAVLSYTGEAFGVPANVSIIGTMNTADRSIALMDTALRRRFEFVEMMPDYEALDEIPPIEGICVAQMLRRMNERIAALYDREHVIGHAYFMPLVKNPAVEELARIFSNKVVPLLQEYFYDDYEKIGLVLADNQKQDPSLRFVSEAPLSSIEGLFGDADVIDGDARTFAINRAAFSDPAAYIGVYE